MTEDSFDLFLSRCIKSIIDEIKIEMDTPIIEVERKIMEKVAKRRGVRRRRRIRIIQSAVLTIVLIGISLQVFWPESTLAFKQKLVRMFISEGDKGHISIGYGTPPLNDKMAVEVDRLQSTVPFRIKIPLYVPPGFEFKEIKATGEEGDKGTNMFFNADESRQIYVIQRKISGHGNYSINFRGRAEKTEVGGNEATLIVFDNGGGVNLFWIEGEAMWYEIGGHLTREQAMKMAESLN